MDRRIPLPRGWRRHTKAAIVQILALSHYAFTVMVARAANERSRRTRLGRDRPAEPRAGPAPGRGSHQDRPDGAGSAPSTLVQCTA